MVNLNSKIIPIIVSDTGIHSHIVRLAFLHKGIECQVAYTGESDMLDRQLRNANPSGEYPFIVHREVEIYSIRPVIEYAEERFPHKPLMTEYPVGRANERLTIYQIERDIIEPLERGGNDQAIIKEVKELVVAWCQTLKDQPFFGSDGINLIDIYFTAILWRLLMKGVVLDDEGTGFISKYFNKMMSEEFFKGSLSEVDKDYL